MKAGRTIKVGGDREALFSRFSAILDSTHLSEGVFLRELEDRVGDLYGSDAVAFNSAGSALLAIWAYHEHTSGVGREWLVPTNTFWATAGMFRGSALVDCSMKDFCMSLDTLVAARKPHHYGVVLTHVGGSLATDYKRIADYCHSTGMVLVEDAAHVLGCPAVEGPLVGSLSHATVFSLYSTKAIPVGEGGILLTRDVDLASFARKYRDYGKSYQGGIVSYSRNGYNLRMDEWTAAVACHQVSRIPDILGLRSEDAYKLSRVVPPMLDHSSGTNWYKYIVPTDFGASRTVGRVYASTDQVHTILSDGGEFPGADWVAANHICLPIGEDSYGGMTLAEVEQFLLGA